MSSTFGARFPASPSPPGGARHPCLWWLLIAATLFTGGCEGAPSSLNPQGPPATEIANLTWFLLGVAGVITLIVVALLFAGLRRAGPEFATPTLEVPRGDNHILSVVAALSVVVLVALALSFTFAERAIATPPTPANLVIEVSGHQWWWEVHYPQSQVTTANEIHLPAGQPVLFKVSSDDVMHSIWIPELQGKVIAMPGQTYNLWLQASQPGTYLGMCAEFCGLEHAKMDFLVIAESSEQFTAWLSAQQKPAIAPNDPLRIEGEQTLLGSACVYCHTIKGTNATGKIGPDLTHVASRQMLGAGAIENNRGNLAGWIIDAQGIKPGNQMPPMHMEVDQLQALLAYLEGLK